jgi:predicted PurR-regulated permease PerM
MVNPMQCVYFLIFILALQQFDGNILGPKILGDSTGLASFWVLFSVIVGGGLFGFVGMVVGIPIFAVIYAYFARSINRKLAKKGFSSDLSDYKVDSYRIENTKSKKGRRLGGKKSEKIND